MTPIRIFISYRRDDSAGYARAVYDALARAFGEAQVFIDVDDIGAGQAFADVIRRAVGESKVLLVLIGKRWLGERERLPPRIQEPGDFVRLEVAEALAGGMQVIPVLLDGTPMPTEAQLPSDLQPLLLRNALAIDNHRFAADIDRLIRALRTTLGESEVAAPPPARSPERTALPAAAWLGIGGALLAGSLAMWWTARSPLPEAADRPVNATATTTTTTTSATRADINGQWEAEVTYDWPNARYTERFDFSGEAGALIGSASFLGVRRGMLEGAVAADALQFSTQTSEIAGNGPAVGRVHRYRGRVQGDEIRFTMQTEGSSTPHVPVEFIARRVDSAEASAGR